CRSQAFGKPMPKMAWVCREGDRVCRLSVESDAKPTAVRVWRADSETRDFRKARWTEEKAASPAEVTAPEKVFRAFYAESEYEADGLRFTLCTQLRILEAKK